MTQDDPKRQEYFRRIRRLKRILRPLPRRGNVHRYPVLKWFANAARKRSYLWSFRKEHVVPAIYVGCILAMLPPPTPQFPLALLFGLLLHCNLMVGTALTFLTNPFTVVPIYYADYKVGGFILDKIWHPKLLEEITPEIAELYNAELETGQQIQLSLMQRIFDGWVQTAVGGLTLGIALAVSLHLIYLLLSRYYRKHAHQRPYSLLGLRKTTAEQAAHGNAHESTDEAGVREYNAETAHGNTHKSITTAAPKNDDGSQ